MVANGSRQSLLTQGLSSLAVDIVGLGMHGSWTALALARMGVGRLRLWDDDTVEQGNLETQVYNGWQLGKDKINAMLETVESLGPTLSTIEGKLVRYVDQPLLPIVVSCADSFETRKAIATAALRDHCDLFIETRSGGHTLLAHAFEPTEAAVRHYLDNFFPDVVAPQACGATGSIAIGFQAASLVAALVTQWKGGGIVTNEHEIVLGLSHKVSMWPTAATD
jgi:molybdopterin/thiamine biosynthesis adenylyltransferase